MGAPKGSKNAQAWQKKTRDATRKKIVAALDTINRNGMAFKHKKALADYIAPMVGQTSGNLTRNTYYRHLLETFLVQQKGAIDLIDDDTKTIHALKAENTVLKMERDNARSENSKLKKYFEKMSDSSQPTIEDNRNQNAGDDMTMAFQNTAELLMAVMERAKAFRVNIKEGIIEDRGCRPSEREVASKSKSKWFIDYVEKNMKDDPDAA